ncbi:MAG: heme exporter protein CcmB [Armatimonadota bacterium]|nr:heme exporter protein CcmB [Armatimonadota bacterium]MDR7533351.1 heme exporter protein CcmB [Armatimonadota bacterium]MDR7536471.1 heme exporter protein CcmB [Armatimonadota bacterium]
MKTLWLLLVKDLRVEWRTRELVGAMALLALLLVVVLAALRGEPGAAAVAMWVTYAFAATLAFARLFALERDHLTALRLAPVDGGTVVLAKALASWAALAAVQIISLPAFAVLYSEAVWRHALRLAPVLGLGGAGLAAAGTLFGGLVTFTRLREALLPVLLLPVALPVLAAATAATAQILDGAPLRAVAPQLQLLGAFAMLFAAASVLLFDHLVEE